MADVCETQNDIEAESVYIFFDGQNNLSGTVCVEDVMKKHLDNLDVR